MEKKTNIAVVTDTLAEIYAELIVLPEFFATVYQFISIDKVAHLAETVPGEEITDALVELSRKYGLYMVGGLPEKEGEHFYHGCGYRP